MKEEKIKGSDFEGSSNKEGSDSSYGGNPLFWIGIAVLVCLIVLTAISVMDLRSDMQKMRPVVTPGSKAITAAGTVGLGRCPSCNTTGIPQCFYCGNVMNWDNASNMFNCPGCGRAGSPVCPNCLVPMVNGGVMPRSMAAGFGGPPGHVVCPGCGFRGIKQPGAMVSNTLCPRCSTRMVRG